MKFYDSSHHQILFLCFHYREITSANLKSCGKFPLVQHLLTISQSHSAIPLCDLSISAKMLSGPLALPFFSLRTVFRISSNRIIPRSISRLSDAFTMLNRELSFVVAGFYRCLKCSVQRSNLSSSVFRGSPVVATNLLS